MINVLEAQSVIADWVYADGYDRPAYSGEAKIGTALIEDLLVECYGTTKRNTRGARSRTVEHTFTIYQCYGFGCMWEKQWLCNFTLMQVAFTAVRSTGMFNINPTSRYLESGLTVGGYWGGSWKGQAFYNSMSPRWRNPSYDVQ